MKAQFTNDQVIEMFEANAGDVLAAEQREAAWSKRLCGEHYDPDYLQKNWRAGHFLAKTIKIKGEVQYVVFYHIGDQGWMVINCFSGVTNHGDLQAALELALPAIAASHNSKFIQGTTASPAMLRVASHLGWTKLGVTLVKAV